LRTGTAIGFRASR